VLYVIQCKVPVCGVALTTLELEALIRLKLRVWHFVCALAMLIRLSVESAVWKIQRFLRSLDGPWKSSEAGENEGPWVAIPRISLNATDDALWQE